MSQGVRLSVLCLMPGIHLSNYMIRLLVINMQQRKPTLDRHLASNPARKLRDCVARYFSILLLCAHHRKFRNLILFAAFPSTKSLHFL